MKNKMSNVIFMIFILFPFFVPAGLKMLTPGFSKVLIPWQLFNAFLILLLYLKNGKVNKNSILILLFCGILFFATLLSPNGDISSCLSTVLAILIPTLFLDHCIRQNADLSLRSLNCFFEAIVYLNLLTIFLYPEGMYVSSLTNYKENWLLGYDNLHIFTLLPAMTFSILYSYRKRQKISMRAVACITACAVSVFLRWSGTSVIAISLVLLYLVFFPWIQKLSIFQMKTYAILSIGSFFGIVVFRVQNLFSRVIVDILEKDLTFTGRTYIWDYIMTYISQKPFLGYGMEWSDIRYNKSIVWRSYHAHNEFLEILYQGGICLFVVFVTILFVIVQQLTRYRKEPEAKIYAWILFVSMIIMLTEVYALPLLFLFLIVGMNIDHIIRKKEAL